MQKRGYGCYWKAARPARTRPGALAEATSGAAQESRSSHKPKGQSLLDPIFFDRRIVKMAL
jgi:hypothetical protein